MMSRLIRLTIGLVFALAPALASYALAQASPLAQAGAPAVDEAAAVQAPDCRECHQQYENAWQSGAHSQALTDPVFTTDWEADGQPPECLGCHTTGYDPATGAYAEAGITCAACHDPVPVNHPLAPASMSHSAKLCGTCHRDTEFEWESSRHGQSDLTCIDCHDPHATTIRAGDTSELCANCHGTRVAAFAHSNHAEQGLTCTDCHITLTGDQPGMGHATHSHSFQVDLNTCTRCHEYEIHNAAAAMLVQGDGQATPAPTEAASPTSGTASAVSSQPKPVNPTAFAAFTGLIGLAIGLLVAPWLERRVRRLGRAGKPQEVQS